MSVPNFSSLAGLEVAEKFVVVVGWGGVEHLTTVSNSNACCFRVALSCFELRWVLTIINQLKQERITLHRGANIQKGIILNDGLLLFLCSEKFWSKRFVKNNCQNPTQLNPTLNN